MVYSSTKIGKVKKIDTIAKLGTIITPTETYLFQIKDTLDSIKEEDLVKFRAEIIHGQKKAFFIKKIENAKDITIQPMKDSIYNSKEEE